jgi:hypothetical protein
LYLFWHFAFCQLIFGPDLSAHWYCSLITDSVFCNYSKCYCSFLRLARYSCSLAMYYIRWYCLDWLGYSLSFEVWYSKNFTLVNAQHLPYSFVSWIILAGLIYNWLSSLW